MIEILREQKLLRQLAEINSALIPERVLFGRGAGARGSFQPYIALRDDTKAHFLSDPEIETPVLVRFSKALDTGGESGRDLREFAVRFYTEEGNFDLFTYSLPVFCIAEPEKLPRLIHAALREPESNLRRPEQLWKFAAANPESMNMLLHLYSGEGTLKSYRTMPGYSPFTLVFAGRGGKRSLVRFRLTPLAGVRNIARQEAEFLAGFDGDVASRDLYETLNEGKNVVYEVAAQLIPEEKAELYSGSFLDATKQWPEHLFPPVKIGKIKLTDNINNYLNDVEKADLSPANLVPGIEFSSDPMLPVLSFFIEDAQRRCLGSDRVLLPVNRSRAEGFPAGSDSGDFLGKFGMDKDDGDKEVRAREEKKRWESSVRDVYGQASEYYRGMSEKQKTILADNITDSIMFLDDMLQEEITEHFFALSNELGKRIEKSLAF